jgi:hypothetical protein
MILKKKGGDCIAMHNRAMRGKTGHGRAPESNTLLCRAAYHNASQSKVLHGMTK